ncbi:GntR family transcriptional regulator [Hydrogenoanaerobacterium sp.]|uniref:GntR family transcriptional regulator n=1 Tax=Hydrogenoanaerobacterium sp. TaxID=2953763 RepID=UPI0028A1A6B0|nr:GntR family transcriptional regulator [Hydrogenoanaerobacterium sp.]
MFVLELQSRVPIYEQMKKKITELVMLGVLQTDEQLPSVRSLARDLGVNPNTVQKAYQELERDGIVYSMTGKGSFIADFARQNNVILQQAQSLLKEALQGAKLAGIAKKEVERFVNETYGEGMNR